MLFEENIFENEMSLHLFGTGRGVLFTLNAKIFKILQIKDEIALRDTKIYPFTCLGLGTQNVRVFFEKRLKIFFCDNEIQMLFCAITNTSLHLFGLKAGNRTGEITKNN